MSIRIKKLAVLVLLMLTAAFAVGQAISGDLTGIVRDNSGAVLPNVTVEVTNLATGLKQTQQTTTVGEYRFVNLPAGHYKVLVNANGLSGGFADVEIQLNKTSTANVVAQVASAGTTVEVTGQTETIDTTTAQIQSTFEAKEAQDLPSASVGSGVLNLALLNAGVANGGGIGAGSGPSVSGQRPRNNSFTVEGVDNNNKSVTGPLVTIPNDAVDQFTVLQNQFSPEFGHSSGGQFNQTVRSGTNQWHGRAFEYFENRNLDGIDVLTANAQRANGVNPFNTRFDDNRFGGQIGGPILHDKLFFFTNWQYEPIGRAGTTNTFLAPTADGYNALNALYPNSTNLSVLQKYLPAAGAASTFLCDQPLTGTDCAPGHSTIPAGNVGFSGPSYSNTLTTANSVDWNISSKDQLRGRYIYAKTDQSDTAANIPAFFIPNPFRFHVFTLGEYHNFTSSLNNEFRLGFNRYYNTTPSGTFAFGSLASFPNLQLDELGGLQVGPDPNGPQYTIQNTYQAVDNLSWIKGRHNFKFGVEYREYISPQTFTQRVRGDYEYSSLALYAADGVPDGLAERSSGNAVYYGNQQAIYAYGNDDFHVTKNLTLNLGLRYELTTPPLANTTLQPLNAIASVPGLITFGAPKKQTKNFAPRLGFAWSPGESGTTSIRGGFSMAYDVIYDNLGILSLPPQLQQTCDVGNVQTSGCFWSGSNFLGNGGLPSVPFAFTDPADARANTSAYVPDQKLPYSETWTLGIQHIFAQTWTAEVRYVGTRGIHLPVQDRLNRQSVVNSSNYLPTYLTMPSAATIAGLTTTLEGLQAQANAGGNYVPAYANAGFNGASVVAFEPYGQSRYDGLQTQLTRNFTHGLQVQAAWTWSHAFDDATADVFSTYLTPRRPQDFQCFKCDYGTSALDRRHRVTIEAIYDLPFFKSGNWFAKNLIGNWEVAPVYTFESPEYATVQSATDTNLNGDNAGDRAILNPQGTPGIGSGVSPITNGAGDTVAYLADNPSAQYIVAGQGTLTTTPRNSLAMPHTNNWDLTALKRINITEHQNFEFQAHAFNVFNHPQFIPGILNDVQSFGNAGAVDRTILIPSNANFNQPNKVFSSNPRILQLVLKYNF